MNNFGKALSTCLITIISLIAVTANAQGVIGGFIEGVGRATGIKPIEDLGRNADEEHRRLKDHNPNYKNAEEGATEMVRRPFTIACTIPYQTITNAVIANCSNWDGRLDGQDLIGAAQGLLIQNGIFQPNEFSGIQIRFCPLMNADGIAPDRGRIYLDASLKGASIQRLASLLAHEMTHINQYRRMGTDNFKCEYSKAYTACGGCQDNNHPLEREAYNFENITWHKLTASAQQYGSPSFTPNVSAYPAAPPQIPVRFCQTPLGTCSIPPVLAPMGSQCQCIGAYGQQVLGSAY